VGPSPRALVATLCFLLLPAAAAGSRDGIPPEVRSALDEAATGRKCAALHRVDAWLQRNPEDVGAHVLRGDLLLDCLRGREALADYRVALALRPGDDYARGRFLETLLFCRRYREAADLLSRQTDNDTMGRRLLEQVRERGHELDRLAHRRHLFRWLVGLLAAAWLLGLGLVDRGLSRPRG